MTSKLQILNLEDNANDAELNESMISARWPECHLIRVDNRQDFITALEENTLDLILSDYTMPNFSGREALAIAREKRPDIPFLFVSGTIGEDAAIEALKNGATDYVLKHRLVRLIPAVDRALREINEHAERDRAEEAMRQSEYKYRQLFESLGDVALLADQQTGKIIDLNRRAEKLLRRSRAEIMGRNQTQFLSLDKAHILEDASVENAQTTTFECEMIRADGVNLPVSVYATRLTLYDRPMILWLCHELTVQ